MATIRLESAGTSGLKFVGLGVAVMWVAIGKAGIRALEFYGWHQSRPFWEAA
jgi:hypothetical protein